MPSSSCLNPPLCSLAGSISGSSINTFRMTRRELRAAHKELKDAEAQLKEAEAQLNQLEE